MSIDFQKLPHAGIRSLIPYKPGKSIDELKREQGITDIVKMASNENPFGCSPLALEALRTIPSHTVATYPSPANHALLPKLAEKHQLNTDQVFISNGSDPIFGLLLNCFALHRHKHIMVHDYAFSTYAIQAHSLHIPVHSIAIQPDWQVDIDNLIQACTEHTALIFIANPNNPTGQLIPHQEINRLLNHLPEGTILVLDEAYHEFAALQYQFNSIEWLHKFPNLVITRTFSKMYGMAGLRMGYALAHPDIINILNRVQLPFTVNQVALTAAHAALDDESFILLSLENNHSGMLQMSAGLAQLGLEHLPSSCNFLTFDCKEDSLKPYNYLLKKGIIVRPLHPYNMNNYLRVSIGTKEQNTRFLDALGTYYQQTS